MLRWITGLILGCLVCLPLSGQAARDVTTTVNLRLLQLKLIETAETGGDELYIDITEYHSANKPSHKRVPAFPLFWPSRHVNKLKDVALWTGDLKDGESVNLVISLVEHDAPPWDTDDLVGSLKLSLKNEKGRLRKDWKIPNRTDRPESVRSKYGKAEKIGFNSEHGHYELFLLVDSRDKKNK